MLFKENPTYYRGTKPVYQPMHGPSIYPKPKMKLLRIHGVNHDLEFNEF